jgi:hypothetical protein
MSGEATLSIILDAVIAVLLIATIGYAFVLNRKLGKLREARAEMDALAARLIESTERARSGLDGLRDHAQQSGERLQRAIDAARGRADELAFLVEKAEALSGRLDGAIGAARPKAAAAAAVRSPRSQATTRQKAPASGSKPGSGPASSRAPGTPSGASPEEADLLKALQGMR